MRVKLIYSSSILKLILEDRKYDLCELENMNFPELIFLLPEEPKKCLNTFCDLKDFVNHISLKVCHFLSFASFHMTEKSTH